MDAQSIVVVGGSLAGLRSVEALRRAGFDGELHLVGDEAALPYDRPPLSKQVLAGDWELERTFLSTHDALADLDVRLHLGDRAIALDSAQLSVVLASGVVLDVDGIVIATGARPRQLDTSLGGVHTLRTQRDAEALRSELLETPSRVVVVGGGFIGAEVAATARGLGHEVSLIEMMDIPFERVLGREVGSVLTDIHRSHGVEVRSGVGCARLVGADTVQQVELTDGSSVDADVVVVGIGVIPNVEWLEGSGLTLDNGVVCDETLLAAPGVVAVGDVVNWPSTRFGEPMRVEHWQNAALSAQHAASRLLQGESVGAYDPVPWFWSDQYDRKLQLAGHTAGFDEFQIIDGDKESRRFAALYGRQGKLTAAFGMNRPRHVMKFRVMIEAGASFAEALAAV